MKEISRKDLFAKLNPLAFKSVEGATVLCKLRGNPWVELSHFLSHLIQLEDTDLHHLVRHFSLDTGKIVAQINRKLETLPAGERTIRDLSEDLMELVEKGWMTASLRFGRLSIRTGDLLLTLLYTPSLFRALRDISPELASLSADKVAEVLPSIVAKSGEKDGQTGVAAATPGMASQAMAPAELGQQEALKRYTTDLTELARNGDLDRVTGRETEVRSMVDILLRRRQNNPLITGEAGVGKTAVVEGFAQAIVQGQVPPALLGVKLLSLDLSLLQAGASMKGEFEQRLHQLIEEVQASETPIILFIDEVHTLVGAGGQAGTGDAANLLKPALARGLLRTIGATTWSEYKKHIEKDPALTRRFQVIQVHEPDCESAVAMLRGLGAVMQKHHGVDLLDSAIQAAVRLSHRFIPSRQLPDKAIALLDTACARVASSQHAKPPRLEILDSRIHGLREEIDQLKGEAMLGEVHTDRLVSLQAQLDHLTAEKEGLNERWVNEKEIVQRVLKLRDSLRNTPATESETLADLPETSDPQTLQLELRELSDELNRQQGEEPLIRPQVDEWIVGEVVSDWTGIPAGKMLSDEIEQVLSLKSTLGKRILGQDHALSAISRRVQTSRAQLDNPGKPVGVFMLAGTSGVGKTETALALADTLYGGEHNLITINMSEYQEAHTVSSLKGAPPGYVGYGEGGVLTEAVRRRPYSVVLLDEIEKAHPDVHELFFQVFDKGWMEDGEGRQIDFKNTLILLTTNAGTDSLMALCDEGRLRPEPEVATQAIRPELLQYFPPALLGRLTVIPYYPLNDELLSRIVDQQLDKVKARLLSQHRAELQMDSSVRDLIASRCQETDSGARAVSQIISGSLLPELSRLMLQAALDKTTVASVNVTVKDGSLHYETVSA